MDYAFKLIGQTGLLMHADIVEQSDLLQEWRKNPTNKKSSVPGDDRSPAWTWMTYLYSNGDHLVMPHENIMVALRTASASITLKGQTSFKKLSQSGLMIVEPLCDFFADGNRVSMNAIEKLRPLTFAEQSEAAKKLGFTLFVKRAAVDKKKHVRVRARFENWSVQGTIRTTSDAITPAILKQMFLIAGSQSGLGDWRPSSPKSPGPFGQFTAEIVAKK